MNRVRKLSMEVLEKYEDSFGENFEDNKRALMKISTITSKELKNKIAGFITKTKKRATRERLKREADQRAREEEAAAEEAEALGQAGDSAEGAEDAQDAEAAPDAGSAKQETATVEATHTWSGKAWEAQEAPAEAKEKTWVSEEVNAVAAAESQPAEASKPEAADVKVEEAQNTEAAAGAEAVEPQPVEASKPEAADVKVEEAQDTEAAPDAEVVEPQPVEAVEPEAAEKVADVKVEEAEASAGSDAEPASDDAKP